MDFGTLRDRDTLGMHMIELGWKKDRCVSLHTWVGFPAL